MDVKELLEEMKASPYKVVEVRAAHTGIVEHVVDKPGVSVSGPTGTWKEIPGTLLANLEREHNKKPVRATLKGEVEEVFTEHNGKFVEEGTLLYTIRHYLTKDEVIAAILKKTLSLFNAPEQAKYYFVPEVDSKIKSSGDSSLKIHDGMDLFIVSRMKRESLLSYSGTDGLIYAVYFKHNTSVAAGEPLIGVCAEEQLPVIQDVVARVKSEWKEH